MTTTLANRLPRINLANGESMQSAQTVIRKSGQQNASSVVSKSPMRSWERRKSSTVQWRIHIPSCLLSAGHRRDVRGARGSDAAGDPGAARDGRGIGDGVGGAVCDEPAGDLEAPQGAGARGPDIAGAGCAAAAVPARGEAARGGHRMAGEIPPVLGGEFPAIGRPARRDEGQGEETKAVARLPATPRLVKEIP